MTAISTPQHTDSETYVFDDYRPLAESYHSWAMRQSEANIRALDLHQIYCAVSGAIVGQRHITEILYAISAMIQQEIPKSYGDILNEVTQEQYEDSLISIWDALRVKFLATSRPSFAISAPNGKFALACFPLNRQVSALLATLFYDVAQIRGDSEFSYELHIERMRNTIQLAEVVDEWAECTPSDLETLHAALIELDAKYAITKLRLTKHEKQIIENLDVTTVEPVKLKNIILNMVIYRDTHAEVEIYPRRWAQTVYAASAFRAAERPERSNVLNPKANKPSNSHINKPQTRKAKPEVQLTEKQILKRKLKDQLQKGLIQFNINLGKGA